LIDLLKVLVNMPDADRRRILPALKSSLNEAEFQEVVKLMQQISNDPQEPLQTRTNSLQRLSRYVKALKAHSRKDPTTGEYTPKLSKLQFISINFSGVGSEFDLNHFGIIWDCHPKRDEVLVIPTTSLKESTQETTTTFNIGRVGFFGPQTVVKLNQIIPVSRKRISKYLHFNPATNTAELVSITPDQMKRIEDGFRIMGTGEQSLFDFILGERSFLPELLSPDQYGHLFRPFVKIFPSVPGTFTYALPSDPTKHYLIKWHTHKLSRGDRKAKLEAWVKAVGVKDPSNKGAFLKTREQVIHDAYADIVSAYVS